MTITPLNDSGIFALEFIKAINGTPTNELVLDYENLRIIESKASHYTQLLPYTTRWFVRGEHYGQDCLFEIAADDNIPQAAIASSLTTLENLGFTILANFESTTEQLLRRLKWNGLKDQSRVKQLCHTPCTPAHCLTNIDNFDMVVLYRDVYYWIDVKSAGGTFENDVEAALRYARAATYFAYKSGEFSFYSISLAEANEESLSKKASEF